MKINKTIFTCLLTLMLHSPASQADIGEITIHGEVIPETLFKGYSIHRLTDETRCPPISDVYVRNQVIRLALVIAEGKRRKITISENMQKQIKKREREIESLGPNADIDERAVAEIIRFLTLTGAYNPSFSTRPKRADVVEEYERLIKNKDPRFTDMVIVRHITFEFYNKDNTVIAKMLLEQGSSPEEIDEKFINGYVATHKNLDWYLITNVKNEYTGDGKEIQPGSIVQTSDNIFIYFTDVKYLSKVELFDEYQNNDNYVYNQISYDLEAISEKEFDLKLWEMADVREDGKPISLTYDYASCP